MRILAINYEFPPLGGGAGNATAHICRSLSRMGCEVQVLTSGFRGLPAEEDIDGYTVHRVPVLRKRVEQCTPPEMASFIINAAIPAVRLTRAFRPAVLHVYFGVPTGPVGLLASRLCHVPYLLSLRGGDVPGFLPDTLGWMHRIAAPFNRRVWDGAAVVVANSPGLRDLAQRSLQHGTVEMAPNGVDLDTYAPPAQPRADGVFRILFVGRLVAQKGARFILEALPHLLAEHGPDVEMVIVGSGSEEEALRKLAHDLDIQDHVRFAGWVGRDEMPACYQQADVFVLPSFEEGMPNVVLEAMASGLPIVTTDIYGNRELVKDGVNGYLLPVGDSEAIRVALSRLMADTALRSRMGRAARQMSLAFGWDNTARAYLDLIRRMQRPMDGLADAPSETR